jgi:hypothetical protein
MPDQAQHEATQATAPESAPDSIRDACGWRSDRARARAGGEGSRHGGAGPIPLTGEGPQKFLAKGGVS